MLNSEQLDVWMSRLRSRKSVNLRADVVAEVNAAIVDLERKPFIPWFLEVNTPLTLALDSGNVALPANFSLEREGWRPYYVLEGTVYYLTKRVEGKVVGHVTEKTSPQIYGIIGDTLEFRPLADQEYTLNFYYYARTDGGFADDGSAVSNLWLLNVPEWVFAKAAVIVARMHLRNEELARDMAQLEIRSKTDAYKYHEARKHQNQDYEVGGASDGT